MEDLGRRIAHLRRMLSEGTETLLESVEALATLTGFNGLDFDELVPGEIAVFVDPHDSTVRREGPFNYVFKFVDSLNQRYVGTADSVAGYDLSDFRRVELFPGEQSSGLLTYDYSRLVFE